MREGTTEMSMNFDEPKFLIRVRATFDSPLPNFCWCEKLVIATRELVSTIYDTFRDSSDHL